MKAKETRAKGDRGRKQQSALRIKGRRVSRQLRRIRDAIEDPTAFGCCLVTDVLELKEFGLAPAAAVVLDATVVRLRWCRRS